MCVVCVCVAGGEALPRRGSRERTCGGVRAYDLRQYELERHSEKGTPLYATIVEACQAPGTQIGISLYDRTGIIVDAWRHS